MERALVFACALCTVAASCLVRLVNDAGSQITLQDSRSVNLDQQPNGGVGAYISFDCDLATYFVVSDGKGWTMQVASYNSPRSTVLVSVMSGASNPIATSYVDAASALGNALGPYVNGGQQSYMDQCWLRFLNVGFTQLFASISC
jgi:hypothetical protein